MGGRRPRPLAVAVLGVVLSSCSTVPVPVVLPHLSMEDPSFGPTFEAYTSAPIRHGNRVKLLLNGDHIFPAQVAAIRSARHTVTYAQYFFATGPPARAIVNALADRCRAGVKGHILLDGFGSLQMPPEDQETLERAGCEVVVFHPLEPASLTEVNYRNHRRILVVDGRVGFTGSSGASSKWMGNGRLKGFWRQTDVEMEGPVVNDLQAAFVENWLEATGEALGGDHYFTTPARRGTVEAQIVRGSPEWGSFAMYRMFLLAIASARRSILITNPYFVPDASIIDAIVDARRRGVRVVLLLPGHIDHRIVEDASRAGFGRLLEAGAEIYEYGAGLLHAKTMIVDGVWATVGSANLDQRSLALNDEINLVIHDRGVAAELGRIFDADLAHSRRIDVEQWRSRSLWRRFVEFLALPLRPQL